MAHGASGTLYKVKVRLVWSVSESIWWEDQQTETLRMQLTRISYKLRPAAVDITMHRCRERERSDRGSGGGTFLPLNVTFEWWRASDTTDNRWCHVSYGCAAAAAAFDTKLTNYFNSCRPTPLRTSSWTKYKIVLKWTLPSPNKSKIFLNIRM